MKQRLPPKPTNTRLSRWVARQVRRWPLALASTVLNRDRRIWRLEDNLRREYEINRQIHHDLKQIMNTLTPPMPKFAVEVRQNLCDLSLQVRIDFAPVFCVVRALDHKRALVRNLSEHSIRMAESCSNGLAHEYAEQLKPEIMRSLRRLIADEKRRW